jgi:alpha-N-arabinofuranosidase
VEYCNRRGRSHYAALREVYGHPDPYGVLYWGIGNEIGGWWEIGQMTAEEYAREVRRYVKLMQRVDPRIKIIGVGYQRDPDWNRELLESAGDVIDFISAHAYHYREVPDYYAAVGSTIITEERLKHLTEAIHVAEYKLTKRLGIKKHIDIAFDEWNAWGWSHPTPNAVMTEDEFTKRFLENDENELYALREGLFTAKYLHIFHRMCNSVTMAAFSPAVNVRGMIFTHDEGIILRSYYHAFDLYVNHTGETVVDSEVESETFNTQISLGAGGGRPGVDLSLKEIPYMDVSATLSREKRKLYVAGINLHKDSDLLFEIVIKGGDMGKRARIWELNGPNVESYNDVSHPNDVNVKEKPTIDVSKRFNYIFPAHSATIIEMDLT